MFCITQIEAGLETADNIQKIQTIIDERPYNFPFGFLVNWCMVKDKLTGTDRIEGIKTLLANIEGSLKLYSSKYLIEVLGLKPPEVSQFLEAMKGTLKGI
jgi:hypothetical protein